MNTDLTRKIDLFVSNRQTLSKTFKIDYDLNWVVSSLILTSANATVDGGRMKEVRDILASKTGMLSSFRSTMEMVVLSKMYLAADPETYIDEVLDVYKVIRGKKIIEYHSFVLSAMTVIDLGKKNEIETIMNKANEIIKRMKKEHPFLTDSDDLTFAVMLAMTDKDVDTIIREMEECYSYLKNTAKVKADANAIQGLSELIIMSDGDMTLKCNKAVELFNAFADHGAKYGRYYEFASLGALIGIDADKDELVDMVIEVADTLKENKGFGNWSIDNRDRLMFGTMLVASTMSNSDDRRYDYAVNNAVITNTIAAIVAEEAAAAAVAANSVTW